jgi:hypothetical protein
MSNPPIQFQKQRELGDLITDTFKFIRQNFKPLFRIIFKITAPVFIILLLAIGYYSYLGMDLMANPFLISSMEIDFELYIISLFILMSALLAFYVLLYGSVLHYIQSYIRNSGVASETEVYSGIKSDFGQLLGILLLVGIISIAGLLLCVLPGVYLWVPLSIAPAIMIFNRRSVLDAIGDAFSLIKDNWWTTFFSLFVITLLVYIIGLIFQFPLTVYYFIKTLTTSQEGSVANSADLVDWVYIFFNVLSSLFQYLLSVIIIIATAFIYYNLDEKKHATGSYERISNLGSSEN